MTIYNLYFFNRHGVCLAYKEWCREKKSGISQDEEFKLVNGMLLSLRSFSHKLATRADQTPMIQCFRTSSYKLNYMETATGLRMILNTDPDAVSISELMQSIFCIFVETVLQNPFVDTSKRIDSELFLKRVDDLAPVPHSDVSFWTGLSLKLSMTKIEQ
uniref:Trafficking protein particle complex subunit n=1 Tax=Globodera pallida TaxID=36090 RepID=A0A183BSU4_GLOPA